MPRPQDATEQQPDESGKHKRPRRKNLLLLKATWRLLFLSETPPGRVHDQRIADTPPSPWPAGSQRRQDLGLQAVTLEGGTSSSQRSSRVGKRGREPSTQAIGSSLGAGCASSRSTAASNGAVGAKRPSGCGTTASATWAWPSVVRCLTSVSV